MKFEFITADTVVPPCLPLPVAILQLPVNNTAKIVYAKLLSTTLAAGMTDGNGLRFVCFPVSEMAAGLFRSAVTVKRSLKELEDAGLIMRVHRGIGEPNYIYTRLSKKEDERNE